MKLVHWPLVGGLLIVTFGTARRGLGRLGSSSLYQMLQPTHQRPVYQSSHCCIMVRWTAVLICLLRVNRHFKTVQQRTIIQKYAAWYTGRWWVGCYSWYNEEGPGLVRAAALPSPLLLAVPNVTAHPSTASIPTWYYSMRHYKYLWSVKGQLSLHDFTRCADDIVKPSQPTLDWEGLAFNHATSTTSNAIAQQNHEKGSAYAIPFGTHCIQSGSRKKWGHRPPNVG